jgi:hypothetical protein
MMMNACSPRRPSLLATSLVAVAVASALVACGGQNLDGGERHAFFVRAALAPPSHANASPAGCVYTADPTNPALFQGRLDAGVADSYQLNLLLQGSDPATATAVTGAHVTLTQVDATPIRELDVVTNAFIPAGQNAVASLTAIDVVAAQMLIENLPNRTASETVIANIELKGRDPAGGSDVTTPVFSFPISVCNGCLVDFSTGNDPTSPVQPNCNKPLAGTDAAQPCFVGQDEAVPCQLCVGARPICDPARQ